MNKNFFLRRIIIRQDIRMFMSSLFFTPLFFTLLLFCVLLVLEDTCWAYTVANDDPYLVSSADRQYYIFTPDVKSELGALILATRKVNSVYQRSFSWVLSEDTSVIITSPRNQVANAFATVMPNSMNVYFAGGAPMLQDFAGTSWLQLLVTHEMAHLYQLDPKQTPSKQLQSVFGNNLMFGSPLTPIFIFPNAFLPTYLVEGNATLNESRWGLGGRLQSGYARALVYSLVRNRKLPLKRIINDHLFFPFGEEKYLVGAYYMAFLANKFGIDKVNMFYLTNGNRYLNPFYLRISYAEHFYQDYSSLWEEFLEKTKFEAERAQVLKGHKVIAKSISPPELSRVGKRVFFLSQEFADRPNLIEWNNGKLFTRTTKFDLGKVFEYNGSYFVRDTATLDSDRTVTGLFDQNGKLVPKTENRYFLDINGGHIAYFDSLKSLDKGLLKVDGNEIDSIESHALLDSAGNVYYFKNTAQHEKTLFKNKEKIISFQAYYAKPADVTSDGIFFISATHYGASLFCYCSGQIKRVLMADTIVDAKVIDLNTLVVDQITADGHSIGITKAEFSDDQPVWYRYGFDNDNLFEPQVSSTAMNLPLNIPTKDYNSISQLKYSSLATNFDYWGIGSFGSVILTLIDPLFYNQVTVGTDWVGSSSWDHFATYKNKQHKLQFQLGLFRSKYEKTVSYDILTDKFTNENFKKTEAQLGISYPLFQRARWSSNVSLLTKGASVDNLGTNTSVNESVDLEYTENHLGSYEPYREFGVLLVGEQDRYDSSSQLKVSLGGDLGYQNFLSGSIVAGRSNSQGLTINRMVSVEKKKFRPEQFQPEQNVFASTIYLPNGPVSVKDLNGISATFKTVFNWSSYAYRFPVSLRRLAPYVTLQHKDYKFSQSLKQRFYLTEAIIATELEILFVHRFPIRFTIGGASTSSEGALGFVNMKGEF